MSINTLSTRNLESERQDLEDTLDSLISDIPEDTNDEDYVDAAEALADWLGLEEHQHIEFIGGQVWLDGVDECLRYAAPDTEATELNQLNDLRSEIYEWSSNITLIDEGSFEEYAQEYARETGSRDLDSWPNEHIDWAAAAEALAQDYQSVEFRETTYLYRS
jgi:hypothetical protein